MKESIEILIRQDELYLSAPFKKEGEFIAMPESNIGSKLITFCSPKNTAGMNIHFYIAEDLLYFKKFTLPLQTPDLKEAISYQLAMFAPFEGNILSAYTAVRGKQNYTICIYAVEEDVVTPLLQDAASLGFKLVGLYPESQRYVTRHARKKEWALLLPGRFPKLFLFSKKKMTDRLLCHTEPSVEELVSTEVAETVYKTEWTENSGFLDGDSLLQDKALLKEFNLLPATFRRPDYMRYALVALCVLNLTALFFIGAVKEYNVLVTLKKVDAEIEKIRPDVQELEQLRVEEKKLISTISQIEGVGKNIDIIRFLERITKTLPENSYLDQLRMNDKNGDIQLQGYTDDIGILTSKLDALGNAKLRSTSRRKNKTYFNVEISRR